jgi:alpha-tubulin suppressor-like RCC1 family protein
VSGLTAIIAIAAGDRFSLALYADGRPTAWGASEHGQRGDGTFNEQHAPVDVLNLTDVTAISTCVQHCLALRKDGTVMAWGLNGDRQLGDGTADDQPAPVKVSSLTR